MTNWIRKSTGNVILAFSRHFVFHCHQYPTRVPCFFNPNVNLNRIESRRSLGAFIGNWELLNRKLGYCLSVIHPSKLNRSTNVQSLEIFQQKWHFLQFWKYRKVLSLSQQSTCAVKLITQTLTMLCLQYTKENENII